MAKSPKKVLICPQHWGLGHVTRSIPVIQYCIDKGFDVYLASSGAANEIMQKEFPSIPVFTLADYRIAYPFKNMYLNLGYQLIKMHIAIIKEHFQIKKLAKEYKIDLIISDARLGASQKNIPSVIITHHLHFPLANAFFEWWSDNWVRFFYESFDQIWIPDYSGNKNISGDLAHQYKSKKANFIGPLSRFKNLDISKKYDIAIILSGPEPQRTYLEEKILSQANAFQNKSVILVRGVNESHPMPPNLPDNIEIKHLVFSKELNTVMCSSDLIICRSGYSSLLDLSVTKRKALLIPTPGQPEQIYLGKMLMEQKMFYCQDQDKLDLNTEIALALDYSSYQSIENEFILSNRLDELISRFGL